MPHGAQCVCQICTCGRHKCPQYRNASNLSLGDDQTSQFQHKASTSSHAVAVTEASRSQESTLDDTRSRYMTSLALKQRNQTSQIFDDVYSNHASEWNRNVKSSENDAYGERARMNSKNGLATSSFAEDVVKDGVVSYKLLITYCLYNSVGDWVCNRALE
ncbi:hypothetical protein GCK32_016603 [Trichostrongylus colubriformis]|uniref:Uncharacterized protein n=1 Tax=Trichostrongylus colubriformis TaxID=6319 RepID=A0AAN8IYJ8_TRICO